jgi:SAM-dependent methyltransferase
VTLAGDTSRTQFVCPRDHGDLDLKEDLLLCTTCGSTYPIINGTPAFIVDESSVFSQRDYASHNSYRGASYGTSSDPTRGIRRLVRNLGHRLAESSSSLRYFGPGHAIKRAATQFPDTRILVIGSGGTYYSSPDCRVIHTDVAFGPNVEAIVDGHDLPFADGAFDLVICVSVLEHVADPWRCVTEIHRVLVPSGFVYAATPFLQPVHMGAYDFTRFTPLGHRRLFRCFDAVEWGLSMGSGSMLAYSLSGFLESCARGHKIRGVGRLIGLLAPPALRRLDRLLARSPAAWDSAGGTFFFGQRREHPVADREIIREYRGGYRDAVNVAT